MSLEIRLVQVPWFAQHDMIGAIDSEHERILTETRHEFVTTAKQLAPVGATGHFRQGIFGRKVAPLFHVVEENEMYGIVVEEGRRPNKGFPPLAALKLWCKRVLGDEGAAFPVARKIAREGTQGQYVFEHARQVEFPLAEQKMEEAGARLVQKLGQEEATGKGGSL